jgi:hypothetical protein
MNTSPTITTTQPIKSAKRLAREAKLAKQDANKRTITERQAEIDAIMAKFQELGIPEVMLGDFPKITKEFIELGISSSGVIKITDIQRELVYLLSNNRMHHCVSMLRAL